MWRLMTKHLPWYPQAQVSVTVTVTVPVPVRRWKWSWQWKKSPQLCVMDASWHWGISTQRWIFFRHFLQGVLRMCSKGVRWKGRSRSSYWKTINFMSSCLSFSEVNVCAIKVVTCKSQMFKFQMLSIMTLERSYKVYWHHVCWADSWLNYIYLECTFLVCVAVTGMLILSRENKCFWSIERLKKYTILWNFEVGLHFEGEIWSFVMARIALIHQQGNQSCW